MDMASVAPGHASPIDEKKSAVHDWPILACRALQKCDKNTPPPAASVMNLYLKQPNHPTFGRTFAIGKQGYIFNASFPTVAKYSSLIRSMSEKMALETDEPISLGTHIDMDDAQERVGFLDVWLTMTGPLELTSEWHLMTINELVSTFEWVSYLGIENSRGTWTNSIVYAVISRLYECLERDGNLPPLADSHPQLGKLLNYAWLVSDKPEPGELTPSWQLIVSRIWHSRNLDEWKKYQEKDLWIQAFNQKDWKSMRKASMKESICFVNTNVMPFLRHQWERKDIQERQRLGAACLWTLTIREGYELTPEEMEIPPAVCAKYEEAKQDASMAPMIERIRSELANTASPASFIERTGNNCYDSCRKMLGKWNEANDVWNNRCLVPNRS